MGAGFVRSSRSAPFNSKKLDRNFCRSLTHFHPAITPVSPGKRFARLAVVPCLRDNACAGARHSHFDLATNLSVRPIGG